MYFITVGCLLWLQITMYSSLDWCLTERNEVSVSHRTLVNLINTPNSVSLEFRNLRKVYVLKYTFGN